MSCSISTVPKLDESSFESISSWKCYWLGNASGNVCTYHFWYNIRTEYSILCRIDCGQRNSCSWCTIICSTTDCYRSGKICYLRTDVFYNIIRSSGDDACSWKHNWLYLLNNGRTETVGDRKFSCSYLWASNIQSTVSIVNIYIICIDGINQISSRCCSYSA